MGDLGPQCLAYRQVNLKPYLSVSEAEPALALAAAASAYGTEALQTGKYSQPSLEGRLPLETRSTPACPSRIRRIHRPKKKKNTEADLSPLTPYYSDQVPVSSHLKPTL